MSEDFSVPKTAVEQQQAARAIYDERKRAEAEALVDELTDRERWLIEEAWAGGASEENKRIQDALQNPHATTLDADRVTRTLRQIGAPPRVELGFVDRGDAPHHDNRVIHLVKRWASIKKAKDRTVADFTDA